MNTYQSLLSLVLALYLMECLVWLREGEACFISWWGGPGRCREEGLWLRNPVPLGFSCRSGAAGGSMDAGAAARRRQVFLERTDALQAVTLLHFVTPSLGVGLYFWKPYFYAGWLGIALLFLGLHWAVAPLYFRAHKALYPEGRTERAFETVLCVFSPFQSMRAMDLLSKQLLVAFDPLASAAVLASPEEFRRMARRRLRERRFTPGGGTSPAEDLSAWLERRGLKTAVLLAPPARRDPASASFCERCEAEYLPGRDRCADCDRPLVVFAGYNDER